VIKFVMVSIRSTLISVSIMCQDRSEDNSARIIQDQGRIGRNREENKYSIMAKQEN
jgi:hypothetical protein